MLLDGGKRALSWADDTTLRLWDLLSLEETHCFVGDDPLSTCALTSDGRLAVVGDQRGRVMRIVLPVS